ncbi:MAG TPA: hypothetical protein VEI73_03365 [Candidatus Acidoferrum sp.]|nr:hypothetical protein [Candidatus Acidoferrum sp.]
MELQTTNSNVVNESNSVAQAFRPEDLPRCQKRTRNGRCRMLVPDHSSSFCPEHARSAVNFRRAADLSTLLTEGLTDFKSATPINDFLSRLLLHQAEGRIPPRRAAIMAYTCNLLLRTLPAIEHELHPDRQNHHEDQDVLDIPSAVARRALEARLAQDAALHAQNAQRVIIDMPGPTRD